jgi:hypothetical protein
MKLRRASFFVTMMFALIAPASLTAADINTAAVVVRFGPDRVETHCVSFTEPGLTGEQLLARAGLKSTLSVGTLGKAVCAIGDTGCPADDCFCQCRGANCTYWSYWHLEEDGWRYAALGAGAYEVTNGAVDGWSWGPGSVTEAVPPPLIDLVESCDVATTTTDLAASVPADTEEISNAASGYLVFGALVVLLSGLFVWRQRRTP